MGKQVRVPFFDMTCPLLAELDIGLQIRALEFRHMFPVWLHMVAIGRTQTQPLNAPSAIPSAGRLGRAVVVGLP